MIVLFFVFSFSAQALEVSGIPEGVLRKLSSQIEAVKSDPHAYDRIDKLLINIMETEQFESVEAHLSSDGQILISVKPVRKITSFDIAGNRTLSQSEIIKYLPINIGSAFDRKALFEAAQKLKDHYTDLGYMNTVITADFKPGPDNTIGITINIDEGAECFVKKLSAEAANPFITLRLNQIAKKFIGRRFTSEVLSEYQSEINEYFVNNRYLNASLTAPKMEFVANSTQVTISYQINDPYRIEFLFKGNRQLTDEDLIQAIDPQSMSQLGFNLTTEAGTRVRDKYLNMGFAKVSVTTQVRQVDESYRREILFTIDEGPKVTVRKLYILGQISRPPQYYSDFIFDHSSELVSRGYYNEKDIERGYKNLITELRNQGFFRARIQSSSVIEGPGAAWVDLQISVYEGPMTEIEKINFSGNKAFTDKELEEALSVHTGGPLHLNKLEESIDKLRQFYQDNGYLEMQIIGGPDSLVTYNKTNTKAVINFRLNEGPKVTVNAIIIDGNDQTKNSVILRELDFKVGDTLTPGNINSSISALQRLGLFGKIEIETFEKGTNTGPRTVIVRVMERNPGLFKMGLGFTNEFNLNARGYVGVSYRNLFGSANSISLRLDQNKAIAPLEGQVIQYGADFLESKITAGYYMPYLIRPHIDFRLNLTRSQTIIQHPNPNPPNPINYTDVQESNSADFLLEKNFGKRNKFIWTAYGFSQDKRFHVGAPPRAEDDIARIGPTVDFDYRDDPFNPTKGHFIRLNMDYSDPSFGSSTTIKFIRATSTVSHYLPIKTSGWVWANSIQSGFVKNMAPGPYKIAAGDPNNAPTLSGVPYQELFTLGTRSTIRGFNPINELIPRLDEIRAELVRRGIVQNDPTNPANYPFALTDYKIDTESSFYLVKSELRFPLFGPVGGEIFYDGGAVIIPGIPMERLYRNSAGFGLRFITPVGPVNFELAYKIDPIVHGEPNAYSESKYQFHFSIGSF